MDSDIPALLNVTEQQFELLRAVDSAAANGCSRPKNIGQAYEKLTGKPIQKPNMFAQLKELQTQGFIIKKDNLYQINKPSLKTRLLNKKRDLAKDFEACSNSAKQLGSIFKSESKQMTVKYVSAHEMYDESVDKIKSANLVLRSSGISELTYPDTLQYLIGCKNLVDATLSGCKSGKLKAKYIMTLNSEHIFATSLTANKNKETAYADVEAAFNKLISLLGHPNLEIRYSKTNMESVILIEGDSMFVLGLPLRASIKQLYGVVFVESKSVCDAYKEIFNHFWQKSTPLTAAIVRKIGQQKLKELREFGMAGNG